MISKIDQLSSKSADNQLLSAERDIANLSDLTDVSDVKN